MTYIGKDVVHYGCGLDLDPEKAWKGVAHSARKNIRKAERAGVEVRRADGTAGQLAELRRLWYHPEDPNFPTALREGDLLYVAHLDGELIGGVILLPVGSHLFLNNLIAGDKGKHCQLQGYLLWHLVNDLKDSGYRYIDVGVSYRPNLYRFFKKWASFHYPVIFNPPRIGPTIRFRPFKELPDLSGVSVDEDRIAAFFHGRPHTILPDMELARAIARDRGGPPPEINEPAPDGDGLQVLDLTELLPIQHGAVVIGEQVQAQELWDRYGCYDAVKTEHIQRALSSDWADPAAIRESRRRVHECYAAYFEKEDVELRPPEPGHPAFRFATDDADAIAERYRRFDIKVRTSGQTLSLPCHQNLSDRDVEYVYAVYRGHLNLCSEWLPTHVKGALKLEPAPSAERDGRTPQGRAACWAGAR